jgi:hypothetical protein
MSNKCVLLYMGGEVRAPRTPEGRDPFGERQQGFRIHGEGVLFREITKKSHTGVDGFARRVQDRIARKWPGC